MQHTLEEFLRALRAADVKVSPAEAIDAARTVSAVGYADRELFKDALCATLAKSRDEVTRFDETFETFVEIAPTEEVVRQIADFVMTYDDSGDDPMAALAAEIRKRWG